MEHIPCNLCGSTEYRVKYADTLNGRDPQESHFRCTTAMYGIHPTIVECCTCGLIYANPRWEADVIASNYAQVEDPIYVQEQAGRVLTFNRNLRPLEALVAPHQGRRLLDVGAHIGVLVQVAEQRGWNASGVEPSEWASEHARERGLCVHTGTLATANLPENSFDAVTIWDVIEHLTDPAAELRQIHRVLKPGGIVAIHTIDVGSPFAKLMGARWPWLMEMHLYYFSRQTLGKMAERQGFEVVQTMTQGRYLRFGYLASRLNAYNATLSRSLVSFSQSSGLHKLAVPVSFGDLFTLFARKI